MAEVVADVCHIDEVKPHPNADRLELAVVKGWQTIIQKGSFNTGDKCVYFQPDCLIDEKVAKRLGVDMYCQTKPKGMRVKSIKLRGEYSHGFAVELEEDWPVGTNVMKHYKTIKFEPRTRFDGSSHRGHGFQAKPHPLFIKNAVPENLRNYKHILEEGEPVAVTEKIHGCVRSDTKITRANGEEVPITELGVGDYVLSYDVKNALFVPAIIESILIQDAEHSPSWFKLEFDNARKLFCTSNHQILTKDSGWIHAVNMLEGEEILSFLPPLKRQRIKLVRKTPIKQKYTRYDIGVAQHHNFVAEQAVIHNSQCGIGMIDKVWMARSKNFRRKSPVDCVNGVFKRKCIVWYGSFLNWLEPYLILRWPFRSLKFYIRARRSSAQQASMYWLPYADPNLVNMVEHIQRRKAQIAGGGRQVIVFCEIYGDVQVLKYNHKPGDKSYVVFDILVDNRYLNTHEVQKYCRQFWVPAVPLLAYDVPYNFDKIVALASGPSKLCERHIREGIVIKPIEERTHPSIGRVSMKCVSDEYLASKYHIEDTADI